MAVPFEEIRPPRLTFSRTAQQGVRTFMIDTANLSAFIVELLGTYRVVGTGSFIINPAIFSPDFPFMVADSIDTDAFDPESPQPTTLTSLSSGLTLYTKTVVTVTYRSVMNDDDLSASNAPGIPDGTFLTLEGQVGGEILSLPSGSLQWDAGSVDLPDDAQPGLMIAHQQFSFVWTRVPRPPWSAMRTLIAANAVNNATFFGYPTGHVLYVNSTFHISFSVNERTLWTLRHNFDARAYPWNHSYRPSTSQFELFEKQNGSKMYTESDLTTLFAFGI